MKQYLSTQHNMKSFFKSIVITLIFITISMPMLRAGTASVTYNTANGQIANPGNFVLPATGGTGYTISAPTWNLASGQNLMCLDALKPEVSFQTTNDVNICYSTNGVAGQVYYSNIELYGGTTNRTLYFQFYTTYSTSLSNTMMGISTNVTLLSNRLTIVNVKIVGQTINGLSQTNTRVSIVQ